MREVEFPDSARIGEPFEIRSTWVNTGVARRYKGATLAWSLLDAKGRVAWVSTHYGYDFASAEPTIGGAERPVSLSTRCTVGFDGDIPQINDGVLVYMHERNPSALVAGDRIPTLEPGRYTLCASLGDPDGTPRLALPLSGGIARRYPVGSIQIA